jgi:hypothetical protein
MLSARKALPIAVIVAAIAITAYVVARFDARESAIASADFRNAVTAEIRNPLDETVLRGTFMLVEEEDDDIERKAALAATPGGEVVGEAEVEFATEMAAVQEVEFAARNLIAGEMYTLVVDGREVATVAADPRGRIAIELNVPLPGAPSPR